jgi:ABC-2 type transport system ATP-binding protein
MNKSDTYVISTKGLSKSYNGFNALNSLDLKVPKNSVFGFLGPNGAGKTTTIKLLLGLIRPTSGSGTLLGQDITSESLNVRKRIGYLAQEPSFYDYMTARELLDFRAHFFYSGPEKEIKTRIGKVLKLIGLEDKADRPIKSFSTGEKQRLGIAVAQINHPDLLILDEPAASLDPIGRRDVLETINNLRKYSTIFYSTHILDDVQRVSDTVAILNNGELISQAPIEKLLDGSGAVIYSVIIKGDHHKLKAQLLKKDWVSNINVISTNGPVEWNIRVANKEVAEAQLLPLLMSDEHSTLVEFSRKRNKLEDIFIDIVEGDDHVNN